MSADRDDAWTFVRAAGPVVATAIHAGHQVRPEVAAELALDTDARRREEDPFTDRWVSVAPNQVVVHRSRFELDLNRPRDQAVYQRPEDAWGLELWRRPPPPGLVQRSLALYDRFYAHLESLFTDLGARYDRFLVLDLHSYNHRREGPDRTADPAANPDVNVGTGAHPTDGRWRPLVERFMTALGRQTVAGQRLDVRENVRFKGGELSHWSCRNFAASACVLALEMKKTFMDEWTGEGDPARIAAIGAALAAALPEALEAL